MYWFEGAFPNTVLVLQQGEEITISCTLRHLCLSVGSLNVNPVAIYTNLRACTLNIGFTLR